jgi:alpha-ribazole phosphatase
MSLVAGIRLHLLRHTKPLVAQGVCYGATDVPCDEAEMQAAAQNMLKTLPEQRTTRLHVISSPLQRCERLAQAGRAVEPVFAYKTDARLAEMNFGAWEMQAWSNISSAELSAWTDDFARYRCGGSGESAGQFVQRVAARWLDSALSGQDQLWITHAGVMRAVQWLSVQPFEDVIALARHLELACGLLSRLRADQWPKGELAFGQLQVQDWPQGWPLRQAWAS